MPVQSCLDLALMLLVVSAGLKGLAARRIAYPGRHRVDATLTRQSSRAAKPLQ
ncbi:hypothetical protein [Massilia horti]|uniref:hypothetical protein n=1 Tax=Massilia horti TaxID=2562153 RepID=UPI001430D6D8|nr:hypothetical protein [Massilia horti]